MPDGITMEEVARAVGLIAPLVHSLDDLVEMELQLAAAQIDEVVTDQDRAECRARILSEIIEAQQQKRAQEWRGWVNACQDQGPKTFRHRITSSHA